MSESKPIILQSDGTLLLDVQHEDAEELAGTLTQFARLDQSQERWHTYEIDNLSLWNAAGSGKSSSDIIQWLESHSRTDLSKNLRNRIRDQVERYGRVRLVPGERSGKLRLEVDDTEVLDLLEEENLPMPPPTEIGEDYALFPEENRGLVKQYLAREGWPVVDLVGYDEGRAVPVELNEDVFSLRDYQEDAVDAYIAGEEKDGGSGVIVLPCGAGKTITGLGLMAKHDASTLIIATHRTARRQWKEEILEKTNVSEDMISEYTGNNKEIRPITITTYHMLTYRDESENKFVHMDLFKRADWGLIIYDEVHLLPAPIFRATAEIQSRRRLGLTATLVREDGREEDVFSLIGPKRYECPWQKLEKNEWISPARCVELRIDCPAEVRREYNRAERRDQHRIAAANPHKIDAIRTVLDEHPQSNAIIIGYYLEPLEEIHEETEFPLITGETPVSERLDLYEEFRQGNIRAIILSKVGNYSVDLPNADAMIQVSGTFGSRQEEAQRLGRLLRPNANAETSHFYNVVTKETIEVEYARQRKLFLLRQGYEYEIEELDELKNSSSPELVT
jgi:DNA excision repair protein ERCC-3